MNFYDKITGNDLKKSFKEFDIRSESLPQEYRLAWKEIQDNLWEYSDFSGRNLVPILDGILGLLEESALEGIAIETVVGEDAQQFSAAVAGVEGAENVHDKWRKQLNQSVAKKLKK